MGSENPEDLGPALILAEEDQQEIGGLINSDGEEVDFSDLGIMADRNKKKYTIPEVLDLLHNDSGARLIPVDSPSEEEDLLLQELDPDHSSDSDYQIPSPQSDDDDDDYEPPGACAPASAPPPQPQPQPGPSASAAISQLLRGHSTRRAPAPLPQPLPSSSDSDSPEQTQPKRKGKLSHKSANPKRGRVGPATSRVREEEMRWHNREEKDKRPDPLRFMPARIPGPTFDTKASWSPLSLFQLFFSATVVRTIIDNTNANAVKRLQAGKKFLWRALTMSDFYVFMAIIIFSGLVKVHHRADYWRRQWPYNFAFPSEKMTRDRFEAILWSLHLSNPREDEENERKRNTAEYDRLFKIKPLYTDIVTACQAHFQPNQNISIDERIVASKARISMKQYMKDKPTKWGYKLFVLADSATAYTWNFFVYSGKSVFTTGQGLSYSSVMDLLPFRLLGGGYTLYVDNFYSSPALFQDLSKKNIGCCGTIRKNRVGFNNNDNDNNDLPKKAERGDLRWIRNDKLLFVKWMDTREVSMCSTVHEAFSGRTVKRKVKEAGVWQTKAIPVPDAVADYNQNMGGVDLSDALIGYYSVHHKTMKWYKTFFYHFVDIAVVNSFLLHKELFKIRNEPNMMKPHTQKTFREQLAAEMLEFAEGSAPPPPPQLTCMPVYYGSNATQSRRYCRLCQDAGLPRVKTPVYCRQCQVPLCLTSKKNCFQQWHDAH